MNKVTILTNETTCPAHSAYKTRIENYFIRNNYEICNDLDADLFVISTCGVTTRLYEIIMNLLAYMKQKGIEERKIFILGCLPNTHKEYLKSLTNVRIVPFGQEYIVDNEIGACIPFYKITSENCLNVFGRQNIFSIEIAEGCLKRCTFCVINRAHGNIKSRNIEDIKQQFKTAISLGYKTIHLFGTDTFCYGYDKSSNIVELIKQLLSINDSVNFMLATSHTQWFEPLYKGLLEVIPYINFMHPVIQHVDNDILKKMGRNTNIGAIYEILKTLKNENPKLVYLTDIMVGFPGETDASFYALYEFIKADECFDFINVYGYDDMEAAPSYKYDNKVSKAKKIYRYNKILKLLKNKGLLHENTLEYKHRPSEFVKGIYHYTNT